MQMSDETLYDAVIVNELNWVCLFDLFTILTRRSHPPYLLPSVHATATDSVDDG